MTLEFGSLFLTLLWLVFLSKLINITHLFLVTRSVVSGDLIE